jgi:hypothetical protein
MRPSLILLPKNKAQLAQHRPMPIQLCNGILKLDIIGVRNAAQGMNKNVVVNGLVALVSAIVEKKTAQLPIPPHKTIKQGKKTSPK